MSIQKEPSPKVRGAVILTDPNRRLLPPSGVPHMALTGTMEEREVREWPWFWRKRTILAAPPLWTRRPRA